MYPLDIGLVVNTKELWDNLQSAISDLPVRIVLEQPEIADWASFSEKIERMRPAVLLLEITNLRQPLEEVVRRIRETSVSPLVFALHTTADKDLILKSLRAGASEYLFPPFGDQLRQALERISAERNRKQQATRTGGRIIGFLSAKGGCGATTLACHTAAMLGSRTQQKVLLADFDMEAALIGFLMKSKSQYTVMDALRNVHRLDQSYWGALISNGVPNLDILAGPKAPAARNATPEQVRYVLRFAQSQYDWIVVDLGRSLNEFSFSAIEEIDETHLVTTLEVPALHQTKQLLQRLIDSGYGLGRVRLLLNRAPKHSDFTLDDIRSMLGVAVYATISSDYASLQDCYAEGKLLPPGAPLARQIDGLVCKIAGLEPAKKKKFSLFG